MRQASSDESSANLDRANANMRAEAWGPFTTNDEVCVVITIYGKTHFSHVFWTRSICSALPICLRVLATFDNYWVNTTNRCRFSDTVTRWIVQASRWWCWRVFISNSLNLGWLIRDVSNRVSLICWILVPTRLSFVHWCVPGFGMLTFLCTIKKIA